MLRPDSRAARPQHIKRVRRHHKLWNDERAEANGVEEEHIDLVLKRRKDVWWLRFLSPRSVSIEEGFPGLTGMQILEISGRGPEDVGVQVSDFEGTHGAIRFVARKVVDLDAS